MSTWCPWAGLVSFYLPRHRPHLRPFRAFVQAVKVPKGCLTRWHLEDLPALGAQRRAVAVAFLAAKPGAVPPEPHLGDVRLRAHHGGATPVADDGAWDAPLGAAAPAAQGGQGLGQGQGGFNGGGAGGGGEGERW